MIFYNSFEALNEKQKVFYVINCFEMEVNNGGLCQFFVNQGQTIAPLVSGYLEIISADKHKQLFDSFVENNRINTDDLYSFHCETVEDFRAQCERYPFEEYDRAFYDLEPLQNHLVRFVREYIDLF